MHWIISIIFISILMPRSGTGYSSTRTNHVNATGKNVFGTKQNRATIAQKNYVRQRQSEKTNEIFQVGDHEIKTVKELKLALKQMKSQSERVKTIKGQLRIIKELNRHQKNGWNGIQWSKDKHKYHELQLMKLFASYRANEDKPTHAILLTIKQPAVKRRKIDFDLEYRIFGDEAGHVQSNQNQNQGSDDDYKLYCCGENTGDNWIACDKCVAPSCKEWYHQKCVGCVGSQDELAVKGFTCVACRKHRSRRKRKR
eukprot:183651_1